jgi:hypothetical protein
MFSRMWGWAELVMERVTRGRVRRVQLHLLKTLADFQVRCFSSQASGCIKRAARGVHS